MSRSPSPQFIETGVPHWLQPPKRDTSPVYTEYTWETALHRLSGGETLTSICRDAHMPDYGPFLRWIHSDENRKARYREAQALATEAMADRSIARAEGFDSEGNELLEDVQRTKLVLDQMRFIMRAWNPDRYAEKKQTDVNVTVDLTVAMEKANERVLSSRKPMTLEGDYETE